MREPIPIEENKAFVKEGDVEEGDVVENLHFTF
jgi:hypothetical protein